MKQIVIYLYTIDWIEEEIVKKTQREREKENEWDEQREK